MVRNWLVCKKQIMFSIVKIDLSAKIKFYLWWQKKCSEEEDQLGQLKKCVVKKMNDRLRFCDLYLFSNMWRDRL